MVKWSLILSLLVLLGAQNPERSTICLNMIVKNESQVIRRCLESVKKMIDYWVIVDTGSTDGTQEIIREFMKGIPGELHERPWVDFGHNRNEALALAKAKGDYLLFIDADETLSFADSFVKPGRLTQDFYYMNCDLSGTQYLRKLLIKSRLDWKWEGVVHEVIESPQAKNHAVYPGITNVIRMEGSRLIDPDKYRKDAALLEKALEKDPSNTKNLFYLAQSYRDAQDYKSALKCYEKRVGIGGENQEIFWCYYMIALLREHLGFDCQTVVDSFCKAYHCRPTRAEPLYHLAGYYLNNKQPLLGYVISKLALSIPVPSQDSFFDQWIYDYGLAMMHAKSARMSEKNEEASLLCRELLKRKSLPAHIRKEIIALLNH